MENVHKKRLLFCDLDTLFSALKIDEDVSISYWKKGVHFEDSLVVLFTNNAW